jgi:hypothetical protein
LGAHECSTRPNASVRACRRCGCTESNACMTAAGPCCWVEKDLCNACLTKPERFRFMAGHKQPSLGRDPKGIIKGAKR